MSSECGGKLLVSFLIAVCSGRVLFTKRENALCVLSIAALLISAAQIAVNGADCVSLVLCALSILVFIMNFHALGRLASSLIVDHYNPLFTVFSLVSLLLAAGLGGVTLYFADIAVTPRMMKEMNVSKKEVRYNGSFEAGFNECKLFERSRAQITIYSNQAAQRTSQSDTDRPVVILAADKRAGNASYEAYMAFLASEGYTVITGEFSEGRWARPPFSSLPIRRLSLLLLWLLDTREFSRQHEFYTFAIIKEYKALLDIADALYGEDARCLVSDEMSKVAAETAAANLCKGGYFPQSAASAIYPVFHLENVLIAPGLGFVQQADPLLAWYLKLPRNRTLDEPKKAAALTAKMIAENSSTK